MRLTLRAGLVLGLAVAAACGDDPPSPVDFNDPAAVSADLSSLDSAFNTDAFQSFNVAILNLDAAAAPAFQPAATVLETLRPKLERTGGQIFLPGLLQSRKLQASLPSLSVAAAQGRIIHDSMYGRVFEWDEATNLYTYKGTTVTGLNGVRFVLYALGLDGEIFEPVTAIGTLDIIDQSTPSKLELHVLVKNTGGSITYVDYTATLVANASSATATVTGSIRNGLSGANNKTLTFNETFAVNLNDASASVHATFELNNPAITLTLNESVRFSDPNIIVDADFTIESTETIRVVGRVTVSTVSGEATVSIGVFVDGHPVASLNGNPDDIPAPEWVDAGGEPLTVADLDALDDLFDALENMHEAVTGLFAPIGFFAEL
jgi:hypothetical protein